MSRKSLRPAAAFLALGSSLAICASAFAQPAGLVYVETNNSNANQNAVLAFHRSASGHLTQLPGSPYATAGTGVVDLTFGSGPFGLGPFANDQPIIANPQHTLLFAVNEGSNSIAVFHIAPDGSLSPVQGSPFASNGLQPVSLALVGHVLTVVNKNQDPAQASAEAHAQPNYTTFLVHSGRLTPVPNSTITATASPSQATAVRQNRIGFSGFDQLSNTANPAPNGDDPGSLDRVRSGDDLGFVFGADFEGGNLQSFEVGRNGILRQNPPQPLPAAPFVGQTFGGGPAPPFPLGLRIHPRLPILYVGFVTISEIGVYDFDREAKLNFVRVVGNPSPANCWLVINREATRLYAMDTAANAITIYGIGSDPLKPRFLGEIKLNGGGDGFQMALSDDGQFLFAISQQAAAAPDGSPSDNTLHVLRVDDDGFLAEVETDQLIDYLPNPPDGTRWLGIVAF